MEMEIVMIPITIQDATLMEETVVILISSVHFSLIAIAAYAIVMNPKNNEQSNNEFIYYVLFCSCYNLEYSRW